MAATWQFQRAWARRLALVGQDGWHLSHWSVSLARQTLTVWCGRGRSKIDAKLDAQGPDSLLSHTIGPPHHRSVWPIATVGESGALSLRGLAAGPASTTR